MRLPKPEHDHKLSIIDAQLNVLRRKEAEFQKVIDEMHNLKSSCQREREELEAQREEIEKSFIPVYQLPPEVLIPIFLLSIQSEFEDYTTLAQPSRFWAPFNLSHVCRSWYKLITSTPELWGYISYLGPAARTPPVHESLRRSKASPLHILHRVPTDLSKSEDLHRSLEVSVDLRAHASRIHTLDFQTHTARAMDLCLNTLKDLASDAHTPLETLALSLLSETSYHEGTEALYSMRNSQISTPHTFLHSCRVKSLKCQYIIPFGLPPQFFVDLAKLELSFARGKSPLKPLKLPVSALCKFLHHTPRLEELVLFGFNPLFDLRSLEAKVSLIHLRVFDWSNPQSTDVIKLMSFLYTPSLVKLDLWLEDHLISSVTRFSFQSSTFPPLPVLEYPSLKDISLQFICEDSAKNVFGKFLFPFLEKLEISSFDDGFEACRDDKENLTLLPPLTDIFRDPRLSNLTHLTLSSWIIPSDIGFARALLGYIPVLTSLTLERCLNVGILLQSLQEHVLVQLITRATPQQRCDVKVCPKLEALTFWGCDDLRMSSLRKLVLARNIPSVAPKLNIASLTLSDANSDTRTEASPGTGQREGTAVAKGRVILPLRKSRRQEPASPISGRLGSAQGISGVSPNALPGTHVMEKSSQHAFILYLRIQDCSSISQVEAESLKSLGVLDVIWS